MSFPGYKNAQPKETIPYTPYTFSLKTDFLPSGLSGSPFLPPPTPVSIGRGLTPLILKLLGSAPSANGFNPPPLPPCPGGPGDLLLPLPLCSSSPYGTFIAYPSPP